MQWLPAYGGSVLALRDQAGRIVATLSGPHPAGWALTIPPATSCTMFPTIEEAQAVGSARQLARGDVAGVNLYSDSSVR